MDGKLFGRWRSPPPSVALRIADFAHSTVPRSLHSRNNAHRQHREKWYAYAGRCLTVRILGMHFLSHTYTLPHLTYTNIVTCSLLPYIVHTTSPRILLHTMHCTHVTFPPSHFLFSKPYYSFSFYTHFLFNLLPFLSDPTHRSTPFPLAAYASFITSRQSRL